MKKKQKVHTKAKNRIRNCVIVVLMMCIIAVTFMLPSLVFAVEDRRLTNYDIHYMAEPVKVVSNKIPLTEKLSLEPQLINEGSYIILDANNMVKRDIHFRMSPEKILDTARKALTDQFIELLISDENKKEVFSFMETAIVEFKPLLMIKSESSDMFLVWAVQVYNDESEFTIVIDDETEKLLSIQCVYHMEGDYVEKEINGTEFGRELANMYGYEYLSMDRIDSTRLKTIKVKMKDKDMESSIKSGESVIGCYMESYYSDTDRKLTLLYNCVDDENYEYYNNILIDEYEDE